MQSKIFIERLHSFTGHNDCVYTLEPCGILPFFFSAAGDGQVVKWDLENPDKGELMAKVPNSIYALHFLAEQNLLITGQNYEGIHLLDWQSKKEIKSLKLSTAAIFDMKSHKELLFVAGGDGLVTVVHLPSFTVVASLNSSTKSARALVVNPHTNELAVGYSDHNIRIFDLNTFAPKHEWIAHKNSVFTLAYTKDYTTLLSGSRDAHIKAWSVVDNYQLKEDVAAHLYAINHLALSPNGKYFATASMDKSVKIWDTHELKLLKVVDKARHAGHGTSVNKILWLSNTELLSAGDDRVISKWRLSTLPHPPTPSPNERG
jgi:WD40 repeat protein